MGDPFGRSPPLPLIFPRRLLVLVTSLAEKDDELQAGRAFTVEHGSPSFHFFLFLRFLFLPFFPFLFFLCASAAWMYATLCVVYGRRNRDKAHTIFHGLSQRETSGFFGRRAAVAWVVSRRHVSCLSIRHVALE